MQAAVIASKQDLAGKNIASFLEGTLPKGMKLHFIEGNQCFADEVNEIEADFLVFASKHRSESGKPTLTVHAPGNWGKAELGGKEKELAPTNSFLLKNYLLALQKKREEKSLDFEVSLEVTHHGPFLSKPAVFIELGSSEKQWQDMKAAEAIAAVIRESTSLQGKFRSAIALGGGHYAPEFTRLVLKTAWALGHICPSYALPLLDDKMLQKALEKTVPKPEAIILDWKGLGSEKQRVNELLGCIPLPVYRARRLLHGNPS